MSCTCVSWRPRAYKPREASSLGRVVVAWRIRQYAWKVQRWTRVVGQMFVHAFAKPLPPSVTTRAGGAIRLMSASQAREFSLLAAYQPSTQSGVWAMSTTAPGPRWMPSTKMTS